jgi:hypothetical protein
VADAIRSRFGLDTRLTEGKSGEWTVLVDGQEVARKGWLTFPSDRKVLDAVARALGTAGGAP